MSTKYGNISLYFRIHFEALILIYLRGDKPRWSLARIQLCGSFDKIPLFNYCFVIHVESNSEHGRHIPHSQTIYTLASTCQLTCLQQ